MTSSYNTSWQIEGENVQALTDFLFGDSIITEGGDCSYEIKKHLPFGRKPMKNIGNIRDITSSTIICIVKAMLFLVVMYGCEIWSIKKTEGWRTDVFKLWCWRRHLRIPQTSRISNQWINTERSLEGLMLKLQYFGQLIWRASLLEKPLMLGKIEGKRRRGKQKMRWLDSITDSGDMNLSPLGDSGGQRKPIV